LLRGDIEKRFKAYGTAIEQGFMTIDEVRYMEDLKPLGMDFIKMKLGELLYNPATSEGYVPNTKETFSMDGAKIPPKGGEVS
jgi:hypothetical protein